jgi:putative phosphoribosyl transferase
MIFRDREHAGQMLAAKLLRQAPGEAVVLGVARGGLPVAYQVACSLEAALEPVVVRRIAAPGEPEVSVGAVAEGGEVTVNGKACRCLGLSELEVTDLARREAGDLARRVRLYHGEEPLLDLTGRTAVVVDDGATTGASARAAGRAARARGAASVVFAAPAIPALVQAELEEEFDDVVVLEVIPEHFAVSYCYQEFNRLRDEDAIAYVHRARGKGEYAPLHPS